ncbi:hypothetical protein MKW92_034704 [Papaver armeniacum]|nr:hypothetical protein MKW92_034704 [Papaver armeniacum]
MSYDPSSSTCTGCVTTDLSFLDEHFRLDDLQFLGYCNGLVCISPYERLNLCIWNPSTNEYKHLPETPLPVTTPEECYLSDIQYGFSYDYEIGEFKVVCLACYENASGSDVYLYTSGSNTWIALDSIYHHVYGWANQVPVNGVIHWEAYRKYEGSNNRRVILSFNFEKEIFQEMPWPDLLGEFNTYLCVLGGSLCIWRFNPNIGVEVWELKDSEVRKSWEKLFTIDMKKHFGLVKDFVPLQSLKNGEFLFGFDNDVGFHVHQYDSKHETPRLLFVYVDSEEYSFRTAVYVDSLVSPNLDSNLDDTDSDSDDGVEVVDNEEDNDTVSTIKKIKRV